MKNFLKKGILPIGAYCPPMIPVAGYNGHESFITEEQYKLVKEAGIDIIYAHSEVMNTSTEKYAFLSLELAEKTGLIVYVRDEIAKEYVSLGDQGYKPFSDLTANEKRDLDNRFIESIKRYYEYKSFGGISFWDEPGYNSFEGIARAKKVFDSVCPDKTFYVNMYPYYISPKQYQFGYWNKGFSNKPTNPHFDIIEGKRNIERYEFLYDEYIRIVKPDFFSYDAYPFSSFGYVTTSVHEVLWELPQFLHGKEIENGVPFWVYLQAGGKWEGHLNVRVPSFAEISLGVGVPLLYGAKGLQVFPYCYPNDWLNDNVAEAGFIDRKGEKTRIYYDYVKVLKHVKMMQDYLIKSKLKGIIKSGEYKNGLPSNKELSKIQWHECIYNGKLSPKYNIEINSYKHIRKIKSDIECLTGCIEINSKYGYFILNNSTIHNAHYNISFTEKGKYLIIKDGNKYEVVTDVIELTLEAGEFFLIVGESNLGVYNEKY